MYRLSEEDGSGIEASEKEPKSNVSTTEDNKIYFYSIVDTEHVLELNKKLKEKADELLYMKIQYGVDIPIMLHIASPGGSLLAGFNAVDAIRTCRVPVHTVIDGYAASAATLMSVVAKKRSINKHAYMLIHQLSGGKWGTYQQQRDDQANMDRFMKMIKDIYKKHTKIPPKRIDEILKHDLWFDAEECLKCGLVDEVLK